MTGTGSISALAAYETNSPCLISTEGGFKHDTEAADLCVGQERLSDSEKRAAIDRAAAAVERCFLDMHETGCFGAAAAYTRARNVWCEMLMKWGRIE
jgi:hypothetical protein